MIQKGKILLLPFRVNLVEWLAENIAHGGNDFSRIAVVFPGKRPGVFLKRALSRKLRKSFVPPAIFQTVDFVHFLHELNGGEARTISSIDEAWLIYRLALENGYLSDEKADFDRFFFWGLQFAALFDELNMELITDERLHSVSSLLSEKSPQYLELVWKRIVELKSLLKLELERYGETTDGLIFRQVASSIDELLPKLEQKFDLIVFAGHFAMREAVKQVLLTLLKNRFATLVWQADSLNWQPFEEIRKLYGEDVIRVKTNAPPTELKLYEAFDMHSEASTVASILSSMVESKATQPEEIAVVLPSEGALMPVIHEAIAPLDVEFNISMGYPFKRTPIFALLKLIFKAQETRNEAGAYHVKDYLNLMLHPYIKNIRLDVKNAEASDDATPVRIALHTIQDALIQQRIKFVSLDEVESEKFMGKVKRSVTDAGYEGIVDELVQVIHNIHDTMMRNFETVSTVGNAVNALRSVIEILMESAPLISYPLAGEFISALQEELDSLENSLLIDEKMDSNTIFSFLINRFSRIRIPFEGTPLSGLQILGLLETRALNFRKVIILDVNEGVVPSIEKEDALLPLEVRHYLGLPDYLQQEEVYRYNFFRLIKGAAEAHILYQNREDMLRSRFIEELIWEEELKAGHLGAIQPIAPRTFMLKNIENDVPELDKDDEYLNALMSRPLSSTSIDTYMRCPLRFYFKYILGLRETGKIAPNIEAPDIGLLIHNILADLYSEMFMSEDIIDWDRPEIEPRLDELIELHFSKKFPEQRGETIILKELIRLRLKKLLEVERLKVTPSGVFRLMGIEKTYEGKMEVREGLTVTLKGIMDRIDCDTQHQTVRIIDYKTGEIERPSIKKLSEVSEKGLSREKIKRHMKSVQLPLYLYLFRQGNRGGAGGTVVRVCRIGNDALDWDVMDAGLYSVKKAEFVSLFGKIEGEERRHNMEKYLIPALKFIISEMFDMDVPIVADRSNTIYCNSCPYKHVCINGIKIKSLIKDGGASSAEDSSSDGR